jgi:rubrerythrin
MLIFSNYNDIFDLLIGEEEKSLEAYNSMARRSETLAHKKVLEQLSREEIRHIIHLKSLRQKYPGHQFPHTFEVEAEQPEPDAVNLEKMSYQGILEFAIAEEKKAEYLYRGIAAQIEDNEVNNLFLKIAQQEKKHRLQLEKMLSFEQ